ncbi:hypothetical protein CLAFUW4_20022 [Fulvia fulva]|uniref:uncharacterized protein n=1 Tax=Passalora fulva TaxID=5499 RepID=UPI002852C117|nr:uncharacterized protein CLAFUR5_20022 [Fulvia fulva]KAK4629706.1 hypothetical protein CLAFUR4_20022 [Fulvia fulva]KAK4630165.1 hypothetical protein CLAFUR0_20022 [Fulvia fulva]WMI38816.1 hypothetical protein CLAFUR5_20022 [Fulvia fulva]WPV12185.1 hypothetical protein CLAFUW4_20022 [Fulvia fulva]WPV27884.1 hypothetical protein CLAFUW7_20022 [Fulvia fulva]
MRRLLSWLWLFGGMLPAVQIQSRASVKDLPHIDTVARRVELPFVGAAFHLTLTFAVIATLPWCSHISTTMALRPRLRFGSFDFCSHGWTGRSPPQKLAIGRSRHGHRFILGRISKR